MTIAIDPGQYSFDPLDFEDTNRVPRETAVKQALAARAVFVKEAKKQGFDARMWTLTGQLKKYKSFGVDDGRVRNVYYATISLKVAA